MTIERNDIKPIPVDTIYRKYLPQNTSNSEPFSFRTQYGIPTLEVNIWNFINGGTNKDKLFPMCLHATLVTLLRDLMVSLDCTNSPSR